MQLWTNGRTPTAVFPLSKDKLMQGQLSWELQHAQSLQREVNVAWLKVPLATWQQMCHRHACCG